MQVAARNTTTQTISYDASAAISNAFGDQTRQIRLAANSACHYKIGDGVQTATTSDPFLPANTIEYVAVSPGQRISAIKAATSGLVTATAGVLTVTELSV
jgi:hypothetical protein